MPEPKIVRRTDPLHACGDLAKAGDLVAMTKGLLSGLQEMLYVLAERSGQPNGNELMSAAGLLGFCDKELSTVAELVNPAQDELYRLGSAEQELAKATA